MNSIKYRRVGRLCQLLFSIGILFAGMTTAFLAAAKADEVPAQNKPISLSEVLSRVLRDSPALAVYPYDLRAADARLIQSSLRPNPELSLELENIAGDKEFKGTNSAEITLALSQVIELGGKRRYRQDVASLGQELLKIDYEVARLDILAEAAGQFLGLVQAQQQLQLLQQANEWSEQAQQAVQRRVNSGGASRAELSQARIAALRSNLAVRDISRKVRVKQLQLAALWGSEQIDFNFAEADLFQLVAVVSYSDLRSSLNQSPHLLKYISLDRLRQAELELEMSQGRQDISVGLGLRRFQATGDQALTLQLAVPLGIHNQNQGGVAQAKANRERISQEQKKARFMLNTELYRLYEHMLQARDTVVLLRNQALPEAEQALSLAKKGYNRGRFSYLELIEVRKQRLSVEQDAINAAVEFHRNLLILEKLTGVSLTSSANSIIKTRKISYGDKPSAGHSTRINGPKNFKESLK